MRLHVRIKKSELMKLPVIEPKDTQLGTLYYHINGIGIFRVSDLQRVKCVTYSDYLKLASYFASVVGVLQSDLILCIHLK